MTLRLESMLYLVLTIFITYLTLDRATANTKDGLDFINNICLSTFKSEMSAAQKEPPKGMGTFICKCVIEKIENGIDLDSARKNCIEKSVGKFSLIKDSTK